MFFGFCLVNSECDAYLAVDHSFVYKNVSLFFSLIFSLVHLSRFISVSFLFASFLFVPFCLDLASCGIAILSSTFPILFFHYWLTMNVIQYRIQLHIFTHSYKSNLLLYRFLPICLYVVFILGLAYYMSKFLAIKVTIFSVLPSTYSVIIKKTMLSNCANLNPSFLNYSLKNSQINSDAILCITLCITRIIF